MTGKTKAERILFHISRFVTFYLLMAFVVTTTMVLFLRSMALDVALIRSNARLTFLYTLVVTAAFCVVDDFRRQRSVDRPFARIMEALEQLGKGDYSVRLDVEHRDFSRTGLVDICLGINALAQELSGVETLRTDFISNVSHELKTPLTAVQNYAMLLRDPTLPEQKQMEYTAAIVQTTRRLADMISNILKLNKLENQQIYPVHERFDLGEQLGASVLEWENAWEKKQLELECDIQEDVFVDSDSALLELVWSNLLSNAIKFSEPGGKLTVRMWAEESWASVSISDTGCGMSPETGAHIFEKFYQGDTAHATQGNGLGLALVKRVVDIMGAEISVSSVQGKGSTFTIRIRRAAGGAVSV